MAISMAALLIVRAKSVYDYSRPLIEVARRSSRSRLPPAVQPEFQYLQNRKRMHEWKAGDH
jgi:hypothetical protein